MSSPPPPSNPPPATTAAAPPPSNPRPLTPIPAQSHRVATVPFRPQPQQPPPPPQPIFTSTTNPRFYHPQQQPQQQMQQNIYPAGRGYVPNSRPVVPPFLYPVARPPFGFPQPVGAGNAPGNLHYQSIFPGNVPPLKGFAGVPTNSKAAMPPSPISDGISINDLRDKCKDDFAIIRDRKVKTSEDASLYSQLRSWVLNGVEDEKQPQSSVDSVKSLPKPLPPVKVPNNQEQKEEDIEEEKNDEDVSHLTTKELLQQHIDRAKKVRARLRKERLQRIERYKARLALLLPPVVDQQMKNDSNSSGN